MATRKQKIQRRLRGIKKGPATQPSKAVTVDENGVVKGGVSTMQVYHLYNCYKLASELSCASYDMIWYQWVNVMWMHGWCTDK